MPQASRSSWPVITTVTESSLVPRSLAGPGPVMCAPWRAWTASVPVVARPREVGLARRQKLQRAAADRVHPRVNPHIQIWVWVYDDKGWEVQGVMKK